MFKITWSLCRHGKSRTTLLIGLMKQLVRYRTPSRRLRTEIALIHEFRTRLIADVVTGKLDVRAAAASLPEIAEA